MSKYSKWFLTYTVRIRKSVFNSGTYFSLKTVSLLRANVVLNSRFLSVLDPSYISNHPSRPSSTQVLFLELCWLQLWSGPYAGLRFIQVRRKLYYDGCTSPATIDGSPSLISAMEPSALMEFQTPLQFTLNALPTLPGNMKNVEHVPTSMETTYEATFPFYEMSIS